ncbi:MAG: hypothetical protein GXP02_04875 [Alphaproteobacteria bacterium]|nr:hypothetical protein [Alphaproteobacteria bacterium]
MARPSDQMRLLIRLDADPRVGLGHAVRVAELLSHITMPLDSHIGSVGGQAGVYFADNVTHHNLPAGNPAEFLELAREIGADMLLIDQPDQTGESWQQYHDSALPVIAIDDYGGEVQADLVFNGTVIDDYHHYPLIADKSRIFCGGPYALLNPVFGQLPHNPTRRKTVLIVIGGGRRARQWALSLTGDHSPFSPGDFDKITMIIGGTFADGDELRRRCARLRINLQQNIPQQQLARMLSDHSVALITGGMIVYEAVASGCPVIIFPQEENLIREAEYFARNDAAINLGYNGGMDMNRVRKALDMKIIPASDSIGGIDGIDGKGMIRVATELNNFLQHFRSGQNK